MLSDKDKAYSYGGDLVIDDKCPNNLVDALKKTAELFPTKEIIYINKAAIEQRLSYSELLFNAQKIANILAENGLQRKDKVILVSNNNLHIFKLFWGCLLSGIIPTIISEPNSLAEDDSVVNKIFNVWISLDKCKVIFEKNFYSEIDKLDLTHPLKQVDSIILTNENIKNNAEISDVQICPNDVAFIQLTSGSTGVPKSILELHSRVIAHIHASTQTNKYSSNDRTLNWLPLDHVVPILTFHLKDVYLGCQQVHVAPQLILSNPLLWLDCLEKYSITHTWSPNFGFELVAKEAKKHQGRQWDLSQIKYFMNAGEQVTKNAIKKFIDVLAPCGLVSRNVQPAFGMAEVATCMTYNNDFDFDKSVVNITADNNFGFVDLGFPTVGTAIRITDNNGKVLDEKEIGNLQIKGSSTFPGYYNNPKENVFDQHGWFNTGDLGFIYQGNLFVTGRAKEVIIVHGVNYYCHEIENILNGLQGIKPTYVAACAVKKQNSDNEQKEALAIFFVADEKSVLSETIIAIKKAMIKSIGVAPEYAIPLAAEEFPKTTSGKIQRLKLKKLFQQGCFDNFSKETFDWFYRKIMVKKSLSKSFANKNHKVMICYHSATKSLSAAVIEVLKNNCEVCLLDISRFLEQINQNSDHDEVILKNNIIDELKKTCNDFLSVTEVIYFPGNGQQTQEYDLAIHDVILLVYIVQVLSAVLSPANRTKLFLVTTSLHSSHPKEISLWGGLSGLLRSLNKENSVLQLYHLDFIENEINQIAQNLADEVHNNISDSEVYYVNRIRYIPKLEQVKHEFKMITTVQRNKHYIIVGGLGGVGFILAEFLLKNYQAHLTIVGRSDAEDAQVLQKIEQLRSICSTVKYFAADVCEQNDVNRLQKYIRKNCDTLQGIFYLAGEFNFISFAQLTKTAVYNELKAKIIGALRMIDLLQQENPAGLFVSFSSLISTIGASGYSMYAMANSFLEWMTDYLCKTTQLKAFCLAWSAWNQIGLSNKTIISKQALENQGYGIIAREQGLRSLEFALANPNINNLLIGLNITNSTVGLIEGTGDQIINLKNKQNLAQNNRAVKSGKILSIEKKLGSIIADSLFVDEVGIMEDFSSLGLTSLTTYRIIDRINKLWGMEIPIGAFFENSTIAKMSEFIDQKWGNSILI